MKINLFLFTNSNCFQGRYQLFEFYVFPATIVFMSLELGEY
jgi:hypothetical protein